jgi:hypothetical protein
MLARPTNPVPPTIIDLRFRSGTPKGEQLFDGWGVPIGGTRL